MKVKILFSYTKDIIPPRCRKSRPVRFHDGETVLDIPEISAAEAPVAIISRGCFGYDESRGFEVAYRWWNGSLWTAVNVECGTPRGRYSDEDNWDWPAWPAEINTCSDYKCSNYDFRLHLDNGNGLDESTRILQAAARSHVIIDGVPHRPAGEPRYVVMTFGMGRNHGGTACMLDSSYNSNIGHDRYFSLLEREAAIALATKIATDRGDTKNLPIVPHRPDFEVLMPEAIRVKPNQQHGDGDPFLNKLNSVSIASGGNPLAVMVTALAELTSR